MKTTGLFTTHQVVINTELGKPFKLIPFGDIHRDSNMLSHEVWKRFLASARHSAKEENAYFLGMGDYGDAMSTSERMVLGGLHDTTKVTLKDMMRGAVKTLANELEFMRGRLIGLLGGNHYLELGGETQTTDHLLASYLRTKYLGVCSFIKVKVQCGNNVKCAFDIFAHHGKGGGTLPGSTFNTLEKMTAAAEADFYLMGHDHKKGCIPSTPRLRLVNHLGKLVLKERTPWLGRTGSFLKAYEHGQVSYNVDAMRAPASLGWIEFEITVERTSSQNLVLRIRGTS